MGVAAVLCFNSTVLFSFSFLFAMGHTAFATAGYVQNLKKTSKIKGLRRLKSPKYAI